MRKPVSIYIVDDHRMIAEGIISLLQNESNIAIAGHSLNAASCLSFFENNTADIILMDINLPDVNGMELCKQIRTKYPGVQVIALSTINQGSYILKMIENGASGYLLKNADKAEIIEAINAVENGKQYFSFEAGKVYTATVNKKNNVPLLTKREKEILKMVAEGMTNQQIAGSLFLSIDTVDTHRKNLYSKLEVNNVASLVRFAIENDLINYK
jgi:DNA-binding NarL/FixJ family response regulator